MSEKIIRIAHVVGKLAAGGVEAVVFNYYKHIDHSRYQFDIYYDDDSTVEPPKELIEMGARFIKIPRYQHLIPYLKALTYAFKKEEYKIVHSHMNSLSVFPLFAAWLVGIPIRIAHSHSIIVSGEGKRSLLKQFLRLFSRVFPTEYAACSAAAATSLFGEKMVNANKVVFLKNAIEMDKFAFNQKVREAVRNSLGIAENELVVGHVGRFTYAKNHLFILKIFKVISCVGRPAKLLLVGDGELMEQTKQHVRELGIEDEVLFAGVQKNPSSFYQAMDLFIMPSHYEGLGIVLIEAQASGLPFLMSNMVPNEAIIHNHHDVLSLQQTVEEWAQHALRLVSENVDRRESVQGMQAAGYDITLAANVLMAYYDDLLKQLQKSRIWRKR